MLLLCRQFQSGSIRLSIHKLACAYLAAAMFSALPALAGPPLVPALPDIVARGGATLAARPPADQKIAITVALPLRQPQALAETLAHLTNPNDPQFRHWLSVSTFADRFGPSQTDYQAVRTALAAGGLHVEDSLPSRMVIGAQGRIADIEQALHIRFGLYRQPGQSRLFLAPDREPKLDVAVPVLGITGLDDADPPISHFVHKDAPPHGSGSGPDGQFTGPDMRHAYYGRGPLTGAGQAVGVFELGRYDVQDVATYFQRVGAPFTVPIVNVGVNGFDVVCTAACHDAEQALDIEEVISMAPGLDRLVYYGGKQPLAILARMASDDLCATLSVSWGWKPNPRLDEPVLQEMAAQGQTLLVATGDDGYHLKRGVVWPADDAWAIAVGGTDVRTDGAGGPWRAEHGWGFSGGGPSPDGIALPDWQAPLITATNGGSATLRNVPDIAADANTDNFSCYSGRCNGGNGGTSYAAPLWAGFVALVNQQEALAGRPSVGFFTPSLYARPPTSQTLHDQTIGFNGKYHDTIGFDLVTGLGSPFGALTMSGLAGR